MSEHRAIWLEPGCVGKSGEDRHWCQDDAWGACEDCGTKSVKYVIASDYEALVSALAAVAEAKMPGAARRIATEALHAAVSGSGDSGNG